MDESSQAEVVGALELDVSKLCALKKIKVPIFEAYIMIHFLKFVVH